MGLGDRGRNQVKKGSPTGLFTKTEPNATEIQTSSDIKIQNTINTEIQESLPEKNDQRKMYNISRSLSERLRKYAFDERRKEVDIVREALDKYFAASGSIAGCFGPVRSALWLPSSSSGTGDTTSATSWTAHTSSASLLSGSYTVAPHINLYKKKRALSVKRTPFLVSKRSHPVMRPPPLLRSERSP